MSVTPEVSATPQDAVAELMEAEDVVEDVVEMEGGEREGEELPEEIEREIVIMNSQDSDADELGMDVEVVIEVQVPLPTRPWEYEFISTDTTVEAVTSELGEGTDVRYLVRFESGQEQEASLDNLMSFHGGRSALHTFQNLTGGDHSNRSSRQTSMSSGLGKRSRNRTSVLDYAGLELDSESENGMIDHRKRRRTGLHGHGRRSEIAYRSNGRSSAGREASLLVHSDNEIDIGDGEDDDQDELDQLAAQNQDGRRRSGRKHNSVPSYKEAPYNRTEGDYPVSKEVFESQTDMGNAEYESNDEILYDSKPRARGRALGPKLGKKKTRGLFSRRDNDNTSSSDDRLEPTRRSGRANKATKNMRERMEDEEIFAEEVNTKPTQAVSVREAFQPLPFNHPFRNFHNRRCAVCDAVDNNSSKNTTLVFCQGCSTSIHRGCLGNRGSREHIVTKIGEENFVLQCRRCVGAATKKDANAPSMAMCHVCCNSGLACNPFSLKKTTKQEEKLRLENGGKDPITEIGAQLINNPDIVLFRCTSCRRGFHFEHLPPVQDNEVFEDVDSLRKSRRIEYSKDWMCKDCREAPGKIRTLVAWRPANIDTYTPGDTLEALNESSREYLVKWEDLSYFQCVWMPGAWVWGVTAAAMRKAFARRDEGANALPKMSKQDAIPEEYLRMEIVLDVKYSSRVNTHTEEIDRARVTEVDEVLVKFHGLGYEEVVWESPPSPSETDRWIDFVAAYNEFVAGRYFRQPESRMKERIEEFRASDFENDVLLEKQPPALTGGELMPYQLEGLNWLVYNFHQQKNVVLADEMGLGKTIQVVAALAALITEKPRCWPFLIVVPNSTCPNWRREIKKWAPSLRVVAYYGVRQARDMAMKYELFPDGCSDLRAHVVVTSYEAPVDEHSRSFFKRIKWSGMIIDEGQRLKNNKNLLYGALRDLKVPFRVLLTGTPLQNNKRELFNLLQFLDSEMNAEKLDEKYAELTDVNLPELHNLIRPFFLRRTKVQVLKFLPPMAQVIIPVTMSVVQKKLYMSILSKSPELVKQIFVKNANQLRLQERGNLNNILMQLRKVLCHPFVYSEAVEERSQSTAVLHRNLVDASSKLQLLELLLPKLHERGHRVLIFSQFLKQLDIIEDFLDGLGLQFQRLDGNVGTLEKQKRIDAYNAPDSPLFAFLLSTRAGGVGINLATADTVIIMDPDFNPHQDIQALSRAHRIGQKKKVLVFQLMTKDSAEEKIVQIGRKKMALDHVLIESMDADDDVGLDLQSILKHGAQALFDGDERNDIHYDAASVDKLLDRSQVEDTKADEDRSAESQFSFARIWANDSGKLVEDIDTVESESAMPDKSMWDKILRQREADAAREAAAKQKTFGRGKRNRGAVDYNGRAEGFDDENDPENTARRSGDADNDTDFAAAVESDGDDDFDEPMQVDAEDLAVLSTSQRKSSVATVPPPATIRQGRRKKSLMTPPKTPVKRSITKKKDRSCRKHLIIKLKLQPSLLKSYVAGSKSIADLKDPKNLAALSKKSSSSPRSSVGLKPSSASQEKHLPRMGIFYHHHRPSGLLSSVQPSLKNAPGADLSSDETINISDIDEDVKQSMNFAVPTSRPLASSNNAPPSSTIPIRSLLDRNTLTTTFGPSVSLLPPTPPSLAPVTPMSLRRPFTPEALMALVPRYRAYLLSKSPTPGPTLGTATPVVKATSQATVPSDSQGPNTAGSAA